MKALITLIVVFAIAFAGFYMYRQNEVKKAMQGQETSATTASGATQNAAPMEDGVLPVATTASSTSSAVKEFTVSAANYSFTPKTITVNKGDTVKLTVTNTGGFHDLKIDEFNVSTKRLASGDSDTIVFVADKAGTFQYYCSVGNHRAMGMWGTLTVNG